MFIGSKLSVYWKQFVWYGMYVGTPLTSCTAELTACSECLLLLFGVFLHNGENHGTPQTHCEVG